MNAKKTISSGFVIAVAVLGLALGACQSKKKVEDSAAATNNEVTSEQAPQIENTPTVVKSMVFTPSTLIMTKLICLPKLKK